MSEENRTDQRKTREMLHYDEICKHLLSYKPILARILKECVEEYHDLSYEAIQACIEPDRKGAHMHIIGRNTEDLTIPEAKILYDLLFTVIPMLYLFSTLLLLFTAIYGFVRHSLR